jgi:hypothetical protein
MNKVNEYLLWFGYNLNKIEAMVASAIFKSRNTFDDDLSRQYTIKKYRL